MSDFKVKQKPSEKPMAPVAEVATEAAQVKPTAAEILAALKAIYPDKRDIELVHLVKLHVAWGNLPVALKGTK